MYKKLLSTILVLLQVSTLMSFPSMASNAIYPTIDLSVKSLLTVIYQQKIEDCSVASLASIECYYNNFTNHDQKLATYNAVNKAGGGVFISWVGAGYNYENRNNLTKTQLLEKAYASLKNGMPCAVRRQNHTAVIVGYKGNSNVLEISGFQVMEIEHSGTGVIKKLSDWEKGHADGLWGIATRNKGVTIPQNATSTPVTTVSEPKITTNAMTVGKGSLVNLSGSISNLSEQKITECGIYITPKNNAEYRAGYDYHNNTNKVLNLTYAVSIQPNTQYTYRAYAIIGGKTYYGQTVSFTSEACNHEYVTIGKCKKCGAFFQYRVEKINKTMITSRATATNALTHITPYGDADVVRRLPANGEVVTIVAQTYNAFDRLWYQTSNGDWIVEGYLKEKEADTTLSIFSNGVSKITKNSAYVAGACSYSGTRPSSVGVYLGLTPSSLSKKGSDTINHSKNPFDIWYTLSDLKPDTTYYYKFYAIVNGKEITSGESQSFKTLPDGNSNISITSKGSSSITTTTARLDAACNYTGTRPSVVGVYLGTSSSSLSKWATDTINHSKNLFDIWYNLSGLKANTTYYYRYFYVVDGKEVLSNDVLSFKTLVGEENNELAIYGASPSNITASSVKLNGGCYYNGARPSSVGVYMGTSTSSMSYAGSDSINHSKNPFDIWYNLSGLSANTRYYYQFYAVVNGKEIRSDVYSFSTAEGASSSSLSLSGKGTSSITASSARVDASCAYSGTRPSSVGVYLGTSSGSMSRAGSDAIGHSKNPFDIWYTLSGLSAGTTYYYQFYAIVDGNETRSGVYSFNTAAETVANSLSLTGKGATNITTTSVKLDASCAYSGTRPSSVGVYMGTSQDSMTARGSDAINHSKNPFDIWYNLSGLSGGTTYFYQFYAIVNGTETRSGIYNFTTSTEPSSNISLTNKGASNVTSSTAKLDASCYYTGSRPSSVGVHMGTDPTAMIFKGSDNINHSKNPFDIWYNISGLSSGTTYYIQFYAVVDGKTVYSSVNSFTTR